MAPSDPDWFYVRCAAILRHLYLRPTGITGLSKAFGRGKRYGVCPRHHVRAYTGILRRCLRELENMGLVEKRADGYMLTYLCWPPNFQTSFKSILCSGREISRIGRRDMDSVAFQTKKALAASK